MIIRNFAVAFGLLATAGSVLLYQRNALSKSRQDIEALSAQNRAVEVETTRLRGELEDLAWRRAAQNGEISKLNETLNELELARVEVSEMPSPEKEGTWPAARPYFYLAKKDIPATDFAAFSWIGGVTDEAANLFGISKDERKTIDDAFDAMFAQLHQAELGGAYRTNTPPRVEEQRKGGNKISIFIPATENPDALTRELLEKVQAALGATRAQLFMERAAEAFSQFDSFSKFDRIVTFIPADENSGKVIVSERNNMSINSYDVDRDKDYTSFQYGHLLDLFVLKK